MTDSPCEIASSSPEWILQTDQAEPENENLQLSSQNTSLQTKIRKGSSSKEFLRKPKKANKPSKTVNLSEYLMETNKRSPLAKIAPGHRTGEICLEEISTEFTNVASVHAYEVNINKAARYCFKKLEDGTFSIEKKPSNIEQKNQDPSQSESTNKRKSKTIGPYAGRYAYKPLKICFKKRSKKITKSSEAKDERQRGYVTLKQTNHLNVETEQQPTAGTKPSQKADRACRSQSSEGTWAAIKSLVMPRKRLRSFSKTQSCFHSQVPLEAKAGNAGTQRFRGKKTSAKLNIPCIRFSRHKKSGHFEVTDEECYTVNRKDIKDNISEPEANQDETALMMKCNLHQNLIEASPDKKVDPIAEQVRNAIHATEKLEASSDRHACDNSQSEITEPETIAGILYGKHTQKNPQESRENTNTSENRGDSEAGTFSLDVLNGKDPASNGFLSRPELGGPQKTSVSEEEETCTGQFKSQKSRPDLYSCSYEQRKLENKEAAEREVMSKDIEIYRQKRQSDKGLISLDYEAQRNEASDNTETGNFLLHTGNVTVSKHGEGCESETYSGKLLPTNHSFTTSDQYDLLLIKAASSLVESVIQSSVQQVIDEMSFDSSQQPSILQS